ncbi:MAG: DNA-binding protein WhiA [Oscillospiraceae bacterium]|nr:DNA-binding protein WhiA [Oscillospiraceae bacterium]
MATSFSASAKAEVCRNLPGKPCCALAECFGVLLFCNSFDHDSVRIITESREFAYILPKLLKRAFDVEFDSFPSMAAPGKLVFQITDPEKLDIIFAACGFSRGSTLAMHLNLPLVEEECCRAAFLRGAFLAGGSVTDPEKAYHFELTTTHQTVAREAYTLIHEVLTFYPKMAARGGGQVLYLKQSDQISDFLACLGASVASMGIIEAKLEKELNNKVNRRCNCDDANTSKVVEAAQEQLTAIRILRERNVVDKLPQKLQQALSAREKHPEASLSELACMMEPPISKPAMNHRLQKLVELSKEGTA